jgi:hypothetical protein
MIWHGFIWDTRRQRWEKVCEVDRLSACSKRLGEIARRRGIWSQSSAGMGGCKLMQLAYKPN